MRNLKTILSIAVVLALASAAGAYAYHRARADHYISYYAEGEFTTGATKALLTRYGGPNGEWKQVQNYLDSAGNPLFTKTEYCIPGRGYFIERDKVLYAFGECAPMSRTAPINAERVMVANNVEAFRGLQNDADRQVEYWVSPAMNLVVRRVIRMTNGGENTAGYSKVEARDLGAETFALPNYPIDTNAAAKMAAGRQ